MRRANMRRLLTPVHRALDRMQNRNIDLQDDLLEVEASHLKGEDSHIFTVRGSRLRLLLSSPQVPALITGNTALQLQTP
jgi:hypothetical protein